MPRTLAALIFTSCVFLMAPLVDAQLADIVTYQGELQTAGVPAQTPHDFFVGLYEADSGGTPLAEVQIDSVPVSDGRFTLPLDFSPALFDGGADRWLEIAVRASGSGLDPEVLSPRQPLTSAPFAAYAKQAGVAQDSLNQAGVAYATPTNVFFPTAAGQLASQSINCPTDGFVIVTGQANANFFSYAGTSQRATLGVSDSPSSIPLATSRWVELPDGLPSEDVVMAMSSQGVFPVTAGEHTFYLLGQTGAASSISALNINLTLLFVPASYGPVEPN